jgi:aryl-alcohol dehydrogenase-like predicted oxidoreductase
MLPGMDTTDLCNGLTVSALGLGCLALCGAYGAVDEERALATLRYALDAGVTLLDTADFYAGGASEELVGRAVAGRRDDAVIATRGGVRAPGPGRPPTVVDGSPGYLRSACEASLRRLGVDRIDLYYLGRVDPAVPIEDSVGALAELVLAGKVRHLGLSEADPDQLRRAYAVWPIAALESEYSLWERHVETKIVPTARELGVGLIAHTPLGRGFLTAALSTVDQLGERDIRRNHPRFQGENFAHNRELLTAVERMATDRGVTTGQLALAWLLAQGPDVVPIPGTSRPEHLAQNLAAASIRLDAVDVARLAEYFPIGAAAGSRHGAHRAHQQSAQRARTR